MPTPYDSDNNRPFYEADPVRDEALWDLLSAYADGEATPAEEARVEALLLQHPAIANELAFLRRTAQAVQMVAEVEPPAALRAAIYAATTGRPTLARRIGMAWSRLQTALAPAPTQRLSLAGGACLAAALAAVALWPHQPHSHAPVMVPAAPHNQFVVNPPRTAPPMVAPVDPVVTPHVVSPDVPVHVVAPHQTSHRELASAATYHVPIPDKLILPDLTALKAKPAAGKSVATLHHNIVLHTEVRHETDPLAQNMPVQKGQSLDQRVADATPSHFSYQPMMEKEYQHAQLAQVAAKTSDDGLGNEIDANHDDPDPAPRPATPPTDGPKRLIRVAHLAQLPPDARRFVTTADLKEQMDARNMGFSRAALDAIQRHPGDIAVIRLSFNR